MFGGRPPVFFYFCVQPNPLLRTEIGDPLRFATERRQDYPPFHLSWECGFPPLHSFEVSFLVRFCVIAEIATITHQNFRDVFRDSACFRCLGNKCPPPGPESLDNTFCYFFVSLRTFVTALTGISF